MTRRGDYGIDAPYFPAIFGALGVFMVGVSAWLWGSRGVLPLGPGFLAAFFLANAASFLYATRRGKFEAWDGILDELQLRGDERVLDMGCGRGAVLTAVAARLTTGRVVGIDLWQSSDQSGNARETTLRNASLEGVADRVEVQTGDMRSLPFPDASFDVVVSSLAIHNIPSDEGRAKAVTEAWRVLKPGGRLAVADIRQTARYVATLSGCGATDVARRDLGWRFWYGNPMAATSLVRAAKRSPA
jgi:arsenite methyltransferase